MAVRISIASNGRYAWWERDADLDLSWIGPLPDTGHETCYHRNYLLTCKQFEYLLRRSGGHCEMCGLAAEDNVSGALYIDHEPELGRWAVRGLLCRTCNSVERFGWRGATTYRANAWYLGMLADLGVTDLQPRQPAVGSAVLDHAKRIWTRGAAGWTSPQVRQTRTWPLLLSRYGPHNLQEIR